MLVRGSLEVRAYTRSATEDGGPMRAVAVALFLAACMSACSGAADSQDELPAAVDSASTGADAERGARGPLAGSSWRLVEFQSMDDAIGTTRPEDPSRYTMRLGTDGTVSLRLDCNQATGDWIARPASDGVSGSFTLGQLAATTAACPPPSMGERLATDAEFVRGYLLRDGRLYLSLMADAGIYVWEPLVEGDAAGSASVPVAGPEDGGPRDWEVSGPAEAVLRESASSEAAIVATLAPGTVLDNLGCAPSEAGVWCDVQPLGGGPRGYVSADLLRPAISPDGSVATGPDDSALRAGQGDFDATGRIPCAQAAGQPMAECGFGVARAGGGYATVVITRTDGGRRAVYFRLGRPIGADTSEADPGEFGATRDGDLHVVRIGSERYEIPEAVVLGG